MLLLLALLPAPIAAADQPTAVLHLNLRTREEVAPESDRYREVTTPAEWKANETAMVICDMWNDHYCRNAARRVAEMAPRMNAVIKKARDQGVLIVHSPSGCMDKYAGMAQRKLAQQAPKFETKLPLEGWCYINEKHEAKMPVAIGQPCDDDGVIRERVRFFDKQIETLEIAEGDAITDSAEAFYLMKQRGIKNVIIMGVHTNMCVLGRPFGIRQMVYQGQKVALMRDMTDTMYNPRDEPFVSHFTGNDLVFEHIERYWCPTITSAAFVGGKPFRFPGDKRKHLVVVMAEDEFDTARTLPPFALKNFGGDFKITCVHANAKDRNDIPGIEVLNDADLAIWSIRRRALPKGQLDVIREYIASGKPLVAIRTTSHAFCLRDGKPKDGLEQWPEFDHEVLGGNYHDHHGNDIKASVRAAEGVAGHPILRGVRTDEFRVFGSLYKTSPLAAIAAPLLIGRAEDLEPHEPVAWTHQRPNGGKVFYTSLGHPKDFDLPDFQRLLRNAVYWAANLPTPATVEQVAKADGC
jgi:nicotinamidase-related amidase/type 1 glutamine amidotransferase